ncbi:MAG TPA: hypothetical protein PL048_07360 [Leptospiraceae bacterium]|nr:hypothetical protein [Leptospiraceae bacterium]HMZ58577.1 hypothetical protein [Leptospiraceae bacterium]HNF14358.1 hypothetical protein [Leptospiraceae bacterium]HNI97934.1 hypothetical protein [Leptospiraceae bacterium]HNM02299.1 hypothetical protein [Leptospiraceae bacterium]
MIKFFFIMIFIFGFQQCTTVGFHSETDRKKFDFGPYAEIKVCTFHEPGISREEIDSLFSEWNSELELYSLKAVPSSVTEMERPGFYGTDILNHLFKMKLAENCDRILYLKGRTAGDMLFEILTLGIFYGIGLKLEIQGAVETATHTRGYIKAKYISLLQLLFTSPESTLVHEGYHLLGCGHQLFMEDCYSQIYRTKKLKERPETEKNFFPSYTTKGNEFKSRKSVNEYLGND